MNKRNLPTSPVCVDIDDHIRFQFLEGFCEGFSDGWKRNVYAHDLESTENVARNQSYVTAVEETIQTVWGDPGEDATSVQSTSLSAFRHGYRCGFDMACVVLGVIPEFHCAEWRLWAPPCTYLDQTCPYADLPSCPCREDLL